MFSTPSSAAGPTTMMSVRGAAPYISKTGMIKYSTFKGTNMDSQLWKKVASTTFTYGGRANYNNMVVAAEVQSLSMSLLL